MKTTNVRKTEPNETKTSFTPCGKEMDRAAIKPSHNEITQPNNTVINSGDNRVSDVI